MASPRVETRKTIPDLTGWTSVPAAAQDIGVSRQWLFDLITAGKITSARRIPGTGDRPAAIVMRTAEVEQLKLLRQAAQSCPECKKLRNLGKQPAMCEHAERADIRVPEEDLETAALGTPA